MDGSLGCNSVAGFTTRYYKSPSIKMKKCSVFDLSAIQMYIWYYSCLKISPDQCISKNVAQTQTSFQRPLPESWHSSNQNHCIVILIGSCYPILNIWSIFAQKHDQHGHFIQKPHLLLYKITHISLRFCPLNDISYVSSLINMHSWHGVDE